MVIIIVGHYIILHIIIIVIIIIFALHSSLVGMQFGYIILVCIFVLISITLQLSEADLQMIYPKIFTRAVSITLIWSFIIIARLRCSGITVERYLIFLSVKIFRTAWLKICSPLFLAEGEDSEQIHHIQLNVTAAKLCILKSAIPDRKCITWN